MRPTPASLAQRHPLKLGPERRGRIEPLFSAPEENDVSEVDQQEEEEDIVQELKSEGAWVLPPSLMAVPAVPGAPVINIQHSTAKPRKPITPKKKNPEKATEDPYLQFMPIPAVPDPVRDSQASRQPKDSLNTVDLNLNIPNRVDLEPSPTTRPFQVVPLGSTTNLPKVDPSLSFEDDAKAIRRKFKRCHGSCVQKQCLPVGNLNDYQICVEKCKQQCSK